MRIKMTTAIATAMVEKIERLQDEISAIYADADMNYVPQNTSKVLRDIIKERSAQREAEFMAAGMLEGFDVVDE